jgi:hypothetical protein
MRWKSTRVLLAGTVQNPSSARDRIIFHGRARRSAPAPWARIPGNDTWKRLPARAYAHCQSQPGSLTHRIAYAPGSVKEEARPGHPKIRSPPPARFTPQQEANSFHARGSNNFLRCFRPRYCMVDRFETLGSPALPLSSAQLRPTAPKARSPGRPVPPLFPHPRTAPRTYTESFAHQSRGKTRDGRRKIAAHSSWTH